MDSHMHCLPGAYVATQALLAWMCAYAYALLAGSVAALHAPVKSAGYQVLSGFRFPGIEKAPGLPDAWHSLLLLLFPVSAVQLSRCVLLHDHYYLRHIILADQLGITMQPDPAAEMGGSAVVHIHHCKFLHPAV